MEGSNFFFVRITFIVFRSRYTSPCCISEIVFVRNCWTFGLSHEPPLCLCREKKASRGSCEKTSLSKYSKPWDLRSSGASSQKE